MSINMIVYIYSNNNLFTEHLEKVTERLPTYNISYCIGSKTNSPHVVLCASDESDNATVFVFSYKFVPQYQKIPDHFVGRLNATSFDNIIIATDCKMRLDDTNNLLRSLRPPSTFNQTIFGFHSAIFG